MATPIVLLTEPLSDAVLTELGPDFEIRQVDGTDRSALLAALAEANAVIIRSATRMDAEAIGAGPELKVIARAGVGLDNVDVDAATKAGVMVVNAPTSNIVSAAEQAINLLLACARHTAAADASLRNGQWKRSAFTGVELDGKTVGIVGFGRIGQIVASRLAAFGMRLLAYDPFVPPSRGGQLGVEIVPLDTLLAESDFITIHLPRNPETIGIIGADALSKVKPGVRIINAARGGLVDEDALAEALQDGRVAGAGIDVWPVEPCTDSPLMKLDNVVMAPHLGASTVEAQEKAGIAVARSVRLALAGEFVPEAVNVAGGQVDELVRPGLPLTEKLGRVLWALADGPLVSIEVEARGEIATRATDMLALAALKGALGGVVEEQVTYVNAPLHAKERGIDIAVVATEESPEYRNVITLRGTQADGRRVSVAGTLAGQRQVQKLVAIDGFTLETDASGYLAIYVYEDRSGIVGQIGTKLGEAAVNIAGMQVARHTVGGEALMVLTLDTPIDSKLVAQIGTEIGASLAVGVDLSQL